MERRLYAIFFDPTFKSVPVRGIFAKGFVDEVDTMNAKTAVKRREYRFG
jgi:hypothetical protein